MNGADIIIEHVGRRGAGLPIESEDQRGADVSVESETEGGAEMRNESDVLDGAEMAGESEHPRGADDLGESDVAGGADTHFAIDKGAGVEMLNESEVWHGAEAPAEIVGDGGAEVTFESGEPSGADLTSESDIAAGADHSLEIVAQRGADVQGESDVRNGADGTGESEGRVGATGEADRGDESDPRHGLPSRYIDAATLALGNISATWLDFQQMRKAAAQRELDPAMVKEFTLAETRIAERLKKALRLHPLWPWLSQYPGLGGVHTARLIARIGDPRRFPGQQCSGFTDDKGRESRHTLVPQYVVGMACPITDKDGEGCPGIMLPPRDGTGTRSLWHYLGLHVVDGRSPRKTKGQQADWDPLGRTAVLMPSGIADAIVRNGVPVYSDIYYEQKERLTRERGVGTTSGIEVVGGPDAPDMGAEADAYAAIEPPTGLRPFRIDALARKIAAKAFVGDLLHEWKRLAGADPTDESVDDVGPGEDIAA